MRGSNILTKSSFDERKLMGAVERAVERESGGPSPECRRRGYSATERRLGVESVLGGPSPEFRRQGHLAAEQKLGVGRVFGGPSPESRRRGHLAMGRKVGGEIGEGRPEDRRGREQLLVSSSVPVPVSNPRHRYSASSTSRFRSSEFPSLCDSTRIISKKKSFSPTSKHDLRHQLAIQKGEFPFEEIDGETVRIKSTPIHLQWNSYEHPEDVRPRNRKSNHVDQSWGFQKQGNQRWFRKPPKVQVVPGILGACPIGYTRGTHTEGGENSGERDPESGYSPLQDSKNPIRVGGVPPNPRNPNSSALSRVDLSRFVGHLWPGAKPRSFAAVVRANPAPTVVVEMQPRGGGRQSGFGSGRGNFGQDRGGFGYGRAGFGQNRGGFGHERGGFGQTRRGFTQDRGRFGPGLGGNRGGGRFNSWRRKDEEPGKEEKNGDTLVGKDAQTQDSEELRNRWEGKSNPTGNNHGEESCKDADIQKEVASKKDSKPKSLDTDDSSLAMGKSVNVACEFCGLFNHASLDCRRMLCEICGFTNHNTFDCKKCLPWNYGPELCATQVEEQSFFFIEECIDSRVAIEKASTAVIKVVEGNANAKQIEFEFMNLIGADTWRWRARPIADKKFLLRFPSAKMVTEWSRIKNLTLRNDAQITIETWSPAVGAKGILQTAWFRVSGIPADQRSIKTLAKIGGLVGKVLEIDEGSRYRYDYVRLKIACRDVTRVPKTAESFLGMYLIDFGFEREVTMESGPKMLKSGITVGDPESQPPAKRTKSGMDAGKSQLEEKNESLSGAGDTSNKGKQNDTSKQSQVCWSAPPKVGCGDLTTTNPKSVAQKSFRKRCIDDDGEKVHIPETLEDSDSDSDSFAQKLASLAGLDGVGQTSKNDQENNSKQIWFMNETSEINIKEMSLDKLDDKLKEDDTKGVSVTVNTQSPEIFLSDDTIVNTQESEIMDIDGGTIKGGALPLSDYEVQIEKTVPEQERRRSERLKKITPLTNLEELERNTEDTSFEGIYSNHNSFSVLLDDDISHITSCMGIVVDESSFDTFNLIRDLEKARDDLYQKQIVKNQKPQTDLVEGGLEEDVPLAIEWINDESSESEDFILVESRRKKREKRKSLMLANSQNNRRIIQETPDDLKKKKGKLSKKNVTKNIRKVKK